MRIQRAIASCSVIALLGCDALLGADFDGLQRQGQGGSSAQSSARGGGGAGGASGGGGGAAATGGGGQGGLGGGLPLVCGDMSGLQPNAPWPMEGYCPTHQGRSPALGFTTPKVRWVADLPAQIASEPIVAADGTAYVVTYDVTTFQTRLHAVQSGTAVWFRDVSTFFAPTLGADGTLYVPDAASLFALDPANNYSQKWEHPLGAAVRSSVTIGGNGTIYVSTGAGVRAITPAGGEAWTATQVSLPNTPVSIGLDGTLYVGTVGGTFYALESNGATKWPFVTTVVTRDAPVVGGADTIYLTNDQHVYAVDSMGGEKWSFSTGQFVTVTPSPFGDTLFAVSIDTMNQYTLWSLNDSGQPNWSVGDLGSIGRFALSADGLLVGFTTTRPTVFDPEAVSRRPDNGAVQWNVKAAFHAATAFPAAAFGADGVAYVGVVNELYAIEAQ